MGEMEFRDIEPGVWKPESEGDEIIGRLIKVTESKKYSEDGKVYHLEVTEENGEIENKVVFGTAVLDDRMSFVNIGDTVRITYEGMQPNKKGQDTKIFKVGVAKAQAE